MSGERTLSGYLEVRAGMERDGSAWQTSDSYRSEDIDISGGGGTYDSFDFIDEYYHVDRGLNDDGQWEITDGGGNVTGASNWSFHWSDTTSEDSTKTLSDPPDAGGETWGKSYLETYHFEREESIDVIYYDSYYGTYVYAAGEGMKLDSGGGSGRHTYSSPQKFCNIVIDVTQHKKSATQQRK